MSRIRLSMLILGPPAILAVMYSLCIPAASREALTIPAEPAGPAPSGNSTDLHQACTRTGASVQARLPISTNVVLRPPFVLIGDTTTAELERLHDEKVRPVTRCLWRSYFDRQPDAPVVIVALCDEAAYVATAAVLDGYDSSAYAGYTQRGKRRIVVNLSTGVGTLTHELCHLLALFDFPEMPEWFDEGLASLHEETVLAEDGLTLTGVSNWRMRLLADAAQNGQLPPLASVLQNPEFRGEGEGLNYALVRGLCLYLQERGLLCHYYRKFRGGVQRDPTGMALLCELLDERSITEVDARFRDWLTVSRRAGR